MLSKDQVQHIARLARLTLKNVEVETYAKQLSQIFDYFELLQEINVKEVNNGYPVEGLENVTRADVVEAGSETERQKLIEAFPARSGDELKVPGVFKEEES